MTKSLFRKSAGYRYMDAYILANIIELGTEHFCVRFLNYQNDPCGKTFSQMTQAARSGSRNFAEGSERLMTSFSTALELLDVARASLCELRDDYNKWLMRHWKAPWPMKSPEAQRIFNVRLDTPKYGDDVNRECCLHVLAQFKKFEAELLADDDAVRANALLILISRTANMMKKYIEFLGTEFTADGGFRERLGAVRSEARAQQSDVPENAPECPKCGASMQLRRTRSDNQPFWGCSEYPGCRVTRPVQQANGR